MTTALIIIAMVAAVAGGVVFLTLKRKRKAKAVEDRFDNLNATERKIVALADAHLVPAGMMALPVHAARKPNTGLPFFGLSWLGMEKQTGWPMVSFVDPDYTHIAIRMFKAEDTLGPFARRYVHEMLHQKHGPKHGPELSADERRFSDLVLADMQKEGIL